MPPLDVFVSNLLLTPRGLGLLILGSGVGMVLATIVFAISAIAVPLLMAEPVDVVTAATMSVGACRKNRKAMAVWAALIVGGMVLGFVTLFFGLVIAFPLFGYATWTPSAISSCAEPRGVEEPSLGTVSSHFSIGFCLETKSELSRLATTCPLLTPQRTPDSSTCSPTAAPIS